LRHIDIKHAEAIDVLADQTALADSGPKRPAMLRATVARHSAGCNQKNLMMLSAQRDNLPAEFKNKSVIYAMAAPGDQRRSDFYSDAHVFLLQLGMLLITEKN